MTQRLPVRDWARDACRRAFTLTALALCAAVAARADEAPACDPNDATQVRLQVSVSGLRSERGLVTATLYPDEAKRFLASGGKLARQRVKTVLPQTSLCFVAPAPGTYALFVYHDENGDRRINLNWFGRPSEGVGFSNNPKLRGGRPDFADVRFEAKAGDNELPVGIGYY